MNRRATGWIAGLAALAMSFAAAAARPERAPLEARLNLRGEAVSASLSTDSRLIIGQCAECEQLRLRLGASTQYVVNGEAVSWGAMRAYLRANPRTVLQVSYRVRDLAATRLAASGR